MSDQVENTDTMQLFEQQPVAEEVVDQQPQESPDMPESRPLTQKEVNHRILRERAEAAERRAADLEYQLQQRQMQQVAHDTIPEDDDALLDINDDAYVEGHQVKKYLKKMNDRVAKATRRLEEEAQKTSIKVAETNLKYQFTDFDKVVTKENLEKLSRTKAPLFRSIMANPDIYDRGYSAYEAIKNLIPENNYEAVDRKLEENRQRPRSAAAVAPQTGDTPLSRAGDYDRRVLTEERKAQLRKQVEEAKRNR